MKKAAAWTYAATCALLLTYAGCLTGPNDPDDAMGESVVQGEGVREEFKYEWERETSPTDATPNFPQAAPAAAEPDGAAEESE